MKSQRAGFKFICQKRKDLSMGLSRCRAWGSSCPPLHDAGDLACGTPRRFFGGGRSYSAVPHGVSGAGCFLSLGPWGGVRRRCGRRAVGGDRVRRSAAATLDACRPLLADHLSYGARWGNPPFARGPPPAVRLGWRLAARTGADQGNPTV
ncbi:unnamed protein product [Pleuronectes platessa]|uniref:Uncharacterized protein n=1 Tax=Pleuronectes platessa TaxID=8262 RepID=A0A9N7Z5L5_PLEPL|nr:unnamed protein product [Pleuronectes platessa]